MAITAERMKELRAMVEESRERSIHGKRLWTNDGVRESDGPRKADRNSRLTFSLLAWAKARRTPEGILELPLRDGTVVTGRLAGCTARTIILTNGEQVAAEDLAI